MQVTTFKVRTVRSLDGVYANPVATWVYGMDNDLDSIAGSQQELLNKALSQANTSGGTRKSLCQPGSMHAPALHQAAAPVTFKAEAGFASSCSQGRTVSALCDCLAKGEGRLLGYAWLVGHI